MEREGLDISNEKMNQIRIAGFSLPFLLFLGGIIIIQPLRQFVIERLANILVLLN